MPKRRRGQGSECRADDESTTSAIIISKRRKKSAQYDPVEICQELYDSVRNYKNDEGRILCEAFIRVPKRRLSAEYYDVVSQPIDLMKIHHKLKNEEYEELEELSADMELMFNNAKIYYKRDTQEFSDATELANFYQSTKTDLINRAFGEATGDVLDRPTDDDREDAHEASEMGEETSSVTMEADKEDEALLETTLEEMFGAVAGAMDGDRDISQPFQLLPSRLAYADYYQIIKEPIDLKMIAGRIQGLHYTSLDELEKDLLLMVKNARTFNAPNSLIYKDAGVLKKVILAKKSEMELNLASQAKSGRKLRPKRASNAVRMSLVYANLEYPPEDQQERAPDAEDEDDDDNDDGKLQAFTGMEEERLINFEEDESGAESSVADGEESVLWTLFNSLKSYKPLGQNLIEPFMKLPSRRHYPDYYDEIDRPISMKNIKTKLKRHLYDTLDDLCEDLDQMFENAQQYNTDESKLFKDAMKLQKFMRSERKKLDSGVRDHYIVSGGVGMEDLPPLFPQSLPSFIPQFFKNEIDEDDYSTGTTPKSSRSKVNRRSTPMPTTADKSRPGVKKAISPEEILRKRLWVLYKTVHDCEDEGRPLILIFMELPSKKDYPDYYQVISEPIDMSMIERKILEDRYGGDQELISDFELMFNNARHYNEENSQVYKDAESLEKILKRKWRSLSPLTGVPLSRRQSLNPRQRSGQGGLPHRLTDLYNTIKDYSDGRGRILSPPFMRLPPKTEYPNYYEVIKKPIDMQRINQRLTMSQYESLDDMVADFVLMFDNACRYNEPDSLIYKDALTLQRVCLEKKAELSDDDDTGNTPDVRATVQEMMMNLFIAVYNHQDEEGRCYSDSFLEFFHQTEIKERTQPGNTLKILTFDQIKRNLNKGRYRRMDRFQQDMFEVFETARNANRTDSQVYEDAMEMHLHFIKMRDEFCKNGEILLSPALSYTERHLQAELDEEKKLKLPKEMLEDEEKRRQQLEQDAKHDKLAESVGGAGFTHKGEVYNIGDFIYLEPRDKNLESHIVCIERMGQNASGETQVQGLWMYRPTETYHLPTRKFLEKEVFRSDFSDNFPLAKALGKCFVMSVKDYFKYKPMGFDDKDVYVCESRYSTKHKCFKKIKVWQMPKNETELVARAAVLPTIRVCSVFADKHHDRDDPSRDDDGMPAILDKARETVVMETNQVPEDGCQYYEQLVLPNECYKLGDCVYVRSSNNRPFIARVDKLWTDKSGNAYFHGPWFMTPVDVEHSPTRLFYRKEVFRSSIESTTPLLAVMGKCVVLALRDYLMCRPYEYNEDDIYLCESKYTDTDRTIRKLPKGLKKFTLSPKVLDDELFFFRKPMCPRKEPSPLLMKLQLEQTYRDFDETSNDAQNMSVAYDNDNSMTFPMEMEMPYPQADHTPQPLKKTASAPKSATKKKAHPSGYIIFAGECRKRIQEENPDMTFGEISKIVGTKWRNLAAAEKGRFEEKAKERAEEQERKQGAADKALDESISGQQGVQLQQVQLHPGAMSYVQQSATYPHQYQVQGQGMMMPGHMQQGVMPFMNMPGGPMTVQGAMGPPAPPNSGMPLAGSGMMPPPNYLPQQGAMAPYSSASQHPVAPAAPARPPSPVFVSVPARTQRLVHSEAYLKYIENLGHEDRRRTPGWERDLAANQHNTMVQHSAKLPVQWLGAAPETQNDAITALWNLRDLMLKDALSLSNAYHLECT